MSESGRRFEPGDREIAIPTVCEREQHTMPETGSPRRTRSGRYVLLGLLLAVGSCAYYRRYRTGQNAMAFDAALWRDHDWNHEGLSPRYQMVGDLLRKHRLVGMTRAEVEELLGPIDYPSVSDLFPYPGYHLGQLPSWLGPPNSTTLPIQFGPDGRVVKVWNPGG